MRLATICIFFAPLTPCCRGGFWSKGLDERTTPSWQTYTASGDAVLTPEEIDLLFLSQDSLHDYTRRPDCFRTAASLIRSHCAQLDMNENERINAAISMTLCEVATAKHHSVPLECVPFSLGSDVSQHSKTQGECVDALSRSAQFWSSYSGYLREVPQLCFAFRRWHDIDTAREIYKNVTLHQGTLLRYLVARERATELNMKSWESRFKELQEVVSQMDFATTRIDSSADRLNSSLAAGFDYTLDVFREVVADIRREQEKREMRLLLQSSRALEDLYQQHSKEVRAIVPFLVASFVQHVDTTLGEFHAQTRTSLNITSQVQEQWMSFGSEINSLAKSIILLSATASEVAHAFDGSIRQAQILNQTQHEASISAIHLTTALSNLTAATHVELEKINNASTSLIQRTLLQVEFGRPSWLFLSFMRAVGTALRVDSASVGYLGYLASSRLLFVVVSFAGLLLRMVFSSLVTISILFLSLKRHFNPTLAVSDSYTQSSTLALHTFPQLDRPQIQSNSKLDPRLRRQYSAGPRVSRIPERLYRPI